MAEPQYRSMNREVLQGTVDGKYKRFRPDTTNIQKDETTKERQQDLAWPYGFYQASSFETPDGRWIIPD